MRDRRNTAATREEWGGNIRKPAKALSNCNNCISRTITRARQRKRAPGTAKTVNAALNLECHSNGFDSIVKLDSIVQRVKSVYVSVMKHADTATQNAAPATSLSGNMAFQSRMGQCLKRDAILCAAARIFHRDGFQGASIDLIASEAGVSRQTIYNHYRDKEALLAAVVDDSLERVNHSMYRLLESFPAQMDNLETALIDFASKLGENCIYNASGAFLRKLVLSNEPLQPAVLALYAEKGPAKFIPALAKCLTSLAAKSTLHFDCPEMAARQFLALINADIHSYQFSGRALTDDMIRESARNGIQTFLKAFCTQQG